jgi:3-oxoacyl-[acyl-carrier-protein] synthase II
MGVAASQLALQDAGARMGDYDPQRSGVVYGSDYIMTMPQEFAEGIRNCLDEQHQFDFSQWADRGLTKVTPLWLLKYLPNMPACHVAIYNDLRGPNNSITVREASSNLSLAESYCVIARGDADLMLSGATGSRVHPIRTIHVALQEQLAIGNGDASALSRPFDLDRAGMVVGEGAGTVVMEELESARRRGARILGEVAGYGSSTVIDRRSVARRTDALRNAMRQALSMAGVGPESVGHVHAHGVATRQGDIDEARAIQEVFGGRVDPVPVAAAKSYFGNLGAAGGVIELIGSLAAMQHGRLFPVLNYRTADPECPVAVVRDHHTPAGESVLNLSVTPQGQAAAVLVRKTVA